VADVGVVMVGWRYGGLGSGGFRCIFHAAGFGAVIALGGWQVVGGKRVVVYGGGGL